MGMERRCGDGVVMVWGGKGEAVDMCGREYREM